MAVRDGDLVKKFLDADYIKKAPLLPEQLKDDDTNAYIAWKVGRLPQKAR